MPVSRAAPEPGSRTWAHLAREAPDLAARVRASFDANLHHVLGTVRASGSPRLSGTEVTGLMRRQSLRL